MSLGQYVIMLSVLKPQCETDRRGRLSLLVVLSSYAKSTIYPPSPFGEGTGVRLLLPLGEAGWGFQPMVSVYTLSILFDY